MASISTETVSKKREDMSGDVNTARPAESVLVKLNKDARLIDRKPGKVYRVDKALAAHWVGTAKVATYFTGKRPKEKK